MGHTGFPDELPIDCVRDLVAAYRAGTLFANRRTNGEHLYTIAGYALGRILTDDLIGASDQTPEQAFLAFADAAAAASAGAVGAKVDWRKVLTYLLTVILPLILDGEES